MKKSKKSLYNMIFGISNQLIVLVIGLIIPRLFIVSYGSEVNGLQSSIIYIYSYISLLEAGIGTATLQALFGAVGKEDRNEANSILSATNIQYNKIAKIYLISILAMAIIYPVTLTTTVDRLTIALMIILSGVGSFLSFISYGKFVLLLQADGRRFVISIVGIVNYILVNFCKIYLMTKGYSIVSVYFASALLSFVSVCFYSIYRKKYYQWVDYKVKPNMKAISRSKNVVVHQISSIICSSTDVLIITYVIKSLKLVSIYNLYVMIFDAVGSLSSNIMSSFQFVMGQTYNTNIKLYREYHKIYEIINYMISYTFYSVAYIMILPFVEIYTRGVTDINYIDPLFPILFVMIKLFVSAREPAYLLINYAGHFPETQNRAIIETVINILVSLIGVHFFGIYGVLAGTSVAILYRLIDMFIYTSKRFLDRKIWLSFKPMLIYMFGFFIVSIFSKNLEIHPQGYLEFFGIAFVVGICVFIFYFIYTMIFNYQTMMKLFKVIKARR